MLVADTPKTIKAADFNLAATLESGQAFRWSRGPDGWFTGVVGSRLWRVRQVRDTLQYLWCRSAGCDRSEAGADVVASATEHVQRYFALDVSLEKVVASFPDDPPLRAAVNQHWGLRVLRQQPWETLASFIASSTKQIVQIRQIVENLAYRFGRGTGLYHSFPTVEVIARASLRELARCKLGFRAKYLRAAARMIDRGEVRLDRLAGMDYERAREELMKLPGVGEKIADCVLLFSCGHHEAFPVDVWVERALRRLYFPGQTVSRQRLRKFARCHFGPYAGWAQQYLFFNERTRGRQPLFDLGAKR
jgi:N-glycosylase/DNA lyase